MTELQPGYDTFTVLMSEVAQLMGRIDNCGTTSRGFGSADEDRGDGSSITHGDSGERSVDGGLVS